jgi:predicted MFS family arabinose efflux permease
MATRTEIRIVYWAGLVQGIVLVTFPAASTIFTSPDEYDLTRSQYGAMFVPQVVLAVTAAVLGPGLTGRFGAKRVYLVGTVSSLAAMALLLVSSFLTDNHTLAYGLLLVATACVGAGFGLTVPALNTFAAVFHPAAVDRSVLVLNALLGLGTALAPIFVAIFVGLGFWWGLPILSAILLAGILLVSVRLPLRTGARAAAASSPGAARTIPARFWLYAGFAVLYGICETMNGNWSQLEMTDIGASTTTASVALTTFWAMVTIGRVLFAAIQRRFPAHRTYRLLPVVLTGAFILIALLPDGSTVAGIVAFGLAGLACSALLPLTISFAQKDLVTISAATSGWVIAAYQLGYGLAAFGAGPLQSAGISLSTIFGLAAIAAAIMVLLSFAIARPQAQRTVAARERSGGSSPDLDEAQDSPGD